MTTTNKELAAAQAAARAAQDAAQKAAEERDRLAAQAEALAEAEEKRQADEKAAFEAERVKVANATMRRPKTSISRDQAWSDFVDAVASGKPSFPAWLDYQRAMVFWQEYGNARLRLIDIEHNARQDRIQSRVDALNARLARAYAITDRRAKAEAVADANTAINEALAEVGASPRGLDNTMALPPSHLGKEATRIVSTFNNPALGYREALDKIADDALNTMINNDIIPGIVAELDDLTRQSLAQKKPTSRKQAPAPEPETNSTTTSTPFGRN